MIYFYQYKHIGFMILIEYHFCNNFLQERYHIHIIINCWMAQIYWTIHQASYFIFDNHIFNRIQ